MMIASIEGIVKLREHHYKQLDTRLDRKLVRDAVQLTERQELAKLTAQLAMLAACIHRMHQ